MVYCKREGTSPLQSLDVMTWENMRKICSFQVLLPFLVTAVLCSETKIRYDLVIVNQSMNWEDARQYCQNHCIDLVTEEIADRNTLYNFANKTSIYFWIGLQKDPKEDSVWKWIDLRTGEGLSENEVSKANIWRETDSFGDCGTLNAISNQWQGMHCSSSFSFFCFDDNLILITEAKLWEDALNYCRGITMAMPYYRYDLLSGPTSADHIYVQDKINRADIDEVWIGLRFLAGEWWWMNGEQVDHGGSLSDCPRLWNHCGVLSRKSNDIWITRECTKRRNFICHRIAL